MKQTIKTTALIAILISVLLVSACTPQPTPKPNPNPPPQPSAGEIILGAEYAFPGQASALAEMGITGVKFYPETYTMWDVMQTSPTSPVDFSKLDAMVKEYQAAGFTNILFGMRHQSQWGSVSATKLSQSNVIPKPEYQDEYEAWWRSVVERYDKDGVDDMPGLLYPINRYEIGVEFSSYEPESAQAYVTHLARAYTIAHEANNNAQVAHVAFLTLGALDRPVREEEYEASFSTLEDKQHGLADMRVILDHPESFDLLNLHSLGDPKEIDRMMTLFTKEMQKRGYTKPVIISDTSPTPFIAYGPADSCTGIGEGRIFHPAKETDRCRLAAYFKKLIQDDPATTAWVRSFIASDAVKRAVIAADNNVVQIDLAFTEDMNKLIFKQLLRAGTGNAAWGGIIDTTMQAGSEQRTVKGRFPQFYAIQQLQKSIKGYTSVKRIPQSDTTIFVYEFEKNKKKVWVAWVDTDELILPGDPVPSKTVSLSQGSVRVEKLITETGKTTPETSIGQGISLPISPTPTFIFED